MKPMLKLLERLLVLLPIFCTLVVIFNIPDSKSWASKLTVIVSLYLIIRFPNEWRYKFKDRASRIYLIITGLTVVYFSLMHLVNDGNFDIARSMFYCLVYFLFLPKKLVSTSLLLRACAIGITVGLLSNILLQDVLTRGRMHFSLNPIPYSFFASAMLIASGYLLSINLKVKALSKINLLDIVLGALGVSSALVVILLTQTRATWLALSICTIVFGVFFIVRPQTRKFGLIFSLSMIVFFTFIASTQRFQERTASIEREITAIADDNYKYSSGIRLMLWNTGVELFQTSPLFGLTRDQEKKLVSDGLQSKSIYPNVRPFIQTDNANFHNQYIQLLVDSGVIGLIFFIGYLSLPVLITFKCNNSELKVVTSIFCLYSFIFLFFDSSFLHNHLIYLYCFMALTFYHIGQSSTSKDTSGTDPV